MAHLEFAIDPASIIDDSDLKILELCFGYEKGVLVSRFPGTWFKQVAESLRAANLDDEKKVDRLTEILRFIKNTSIHRFNRAYPETGSWLESARISHEGTPFHRVVEAGTDAPPVWINALGNLSAADFSVERRYLRTSEGIADAAAVILESAEKVTLVDPYFDLGKRGCQDVLMAMIDRCRKSNIEIVVFSKGDGRDGISPPPARFVDALPTNIKLKWIVLTDGDTRILHQRVIFTAKGGLIYDRGFEQPNDHTHRENYANISLMTNSQLDADSRLYNDCQIKEPLNIEYLWESN